MDDRQGRLLQRGRESFRAGQYDKAEKALTPLARERIPYADVYSMLGSIHYQKGRLLDALALFDEALRLNPGYTEAALNLALTYNDLGKYEESKRVYQRMIAARKDSGPDNVDPFVKGKIANMHADVAIAYEQAGLHEEAATEYRRALSLCPTFYAAGRRSDAAREWREVLAMEPGNKFAKLYLRLISERDARPRRSPF
jgi:tetratricopeptide (TPR) repeat protein